ncbi:hypothetical protein SprV_0100314700 [Sparganum proliferum]
MSFGLRDAAQSFRRSIDEVLRGISFTYVYIDDILVASSSAEEHASHFRQIFDRSQQHGLQLNVDKWIFGVSSPDFLGHHADQHGIGPLLVKLQSILSFPVPKTLTQLRRCIDLLNYYRCFIPHCAATLVPLTDLLNSKAKPIDFSPAAHSAFEAAKEALADTTLLHHLSSDPHAQLILTTGASNSAVGAVLHKRVKPDRYSSREVRHQDYIPQFTADIRYVRGSDNVVADALSRPGINILTSDFDLAKLADLQSGDKSIDNLRSTITL